MAKDRNVAEQPAAAPESGHRNYNERRWMKPSKRAEGYAKDRRAKVHTYGPKEGQELTEYDKGIRSGYLLCQSDHAGMFRYRQAMDAFDDKEYAKQFSKEKGTKLKEGGKKK